MTNVKVYASELESGMELANGTTVVTVQHFLYSSTTLYTDSNGMTHEVWSFQPIATAEQTNCIYGGMKVGHASHGFCTADSCY